MFIPGHARLIHTLFEPQNEKTCLRGLPPSTIQTALLSYTDGKTQILHIGTLSIVISKQSTQMVLIRLRGFADRFTP